MDPIDKVSSESFSLTNLNQGRMKQNESFQDIFRSLISHTDNMIKDANQKAEDFAVGKNHNIHEIMIASEKAGLTFKFLLQIRNKLLEAYQEIMRMTF
ncbi:MAG: flagellar hook-basal body complex protein FliE [Deltaproteobacteria bacterium]|nr:flagellar hook-basal body complex protein FliE [Deltaproteobacteria bacterium]